MKYPIKIGMRILGKNNLFPLIFDLKTHPHLIFNGPSGSGKSYCLKYVIFSLLKYQNEIEIYCCDFKNSGDYEFMDEGHLSVGIECLDMLNKIYERYEEIKEKNLSNIVLCIFDEYAAFITWLTNADKKQGKEIMDKVSEMLMMGRKLNKSGGGAYMWTVLQRPDATYFGTARENYFVKIIMRDVTRSIRTMLEIDEEEIPSEHIAKPGHGIAMIDDEIYAFIVPTYNEQQMNAMLKAKRSEAESIAEMLPT